MKKPFVYKGISTKISQNGPNSLTCGLEVLKPPGVVSCSSVNVSMEQLSNINKTRGEHGLPFNFQSFETGKSYIWSVMDFSSFNLQ